MRVFNISHRDQEGVLEFGQKVKTAEYVNLTKEETDENVKCKDRNVFIKTGAKKIVTMLIEMDNKSMMKPVVEEL